MSTFHAVMGILLWVFGTAPFLFAADQQEKVSLFEDKLIDAQRSGQFTTDNWGRVLIVSITSTEGKENTLKSALSAAIKRALQVPVTICEPCFLTQGTWDKKSEISRNYLDRARLKDIIQSQPEWGEIGVYAYFQEDGRRLSWRFEEAGSGDILAAGVADEKGNWSLRDRKKATLNEAEERRQAGLPLLHTAFDIGVYPSVHIGFDFLEQWGTYNQRLTGLTISAVGPTGGLGVAHYEVLQQLNNTMVGAQLLFNIPRIISSQTDSGSDSDSEGESEYALNVIVRYPFTSSGIWNVLAFASTDANFGLGLSIIGVDL